MHQRAFGVIALVLGLAGPAPAAEGPAKVLLKALKSKDSSERADAAFNLGYYKTPEVVSALIGALQDKSPSVRANAAIGLHNIGKPDAKPAEGALRSALGDPAAIVRVKAADALHQLGVPGRELLPVVRGALADRDNHVKVAAAESYVRFKGESGPEVAALATALRDPDPQVRSEAVLAIGKIFDPLPPEGLALLKEAARDKDSTVRGHATAALGSRKASNAEAAAAPSGKASGPSGQVSTLVAALKDKNSGVRSGAADSLARLETAAASATPALLAALSDNSGDVRAAAARALGQVGAPPAEAVPALMRALDDRDRDVRKDAAEALGHFGAPAREAALPKLREMWKTEKDVFVHNAVGGALQRLGEKVDWKVK